MLTETAAPRTYNPCADVADVVLNVYESTSTGSSIDRLAISRRDHSTERILVDFASYLSAKINHLLGICASRLDAYSTDSFLTVWSQTNGIKILPSLNPNVPADLYRHDFELFDPADLRDGSEFFKDPENPNSLYISHHVAERGEFTLMFHPLPDFYENPPHPTPILEIWKYFGFRGHADLVLDANIEIETSPFFARI